MSNATNSLVRYVLSYLHNGIINKNGLEVNGNRIIGVSFFVPPKVSITLCINLYWV